MPRAARAIAVAIAVAAAGILVAVAPAAAQSTNPRPYVGVSGLFVQLEEDDVSGPLGSLRIGSEDGFGFAAALGAAAPTGGRVEIEAAFRTNDVDRRCAPACAGASGQTESLSAMLNLLYDVPTGVRLRPYLGVGMGAALVAFDSRDFAADGDDVVFAYQFLGGLGVEVTRTATLVGGYRYFATTDARISGLDVDYRSHNIEIGIRFGF